jgi:hypothetical protein
VFANLLLDLIWEEWLCVAFGIIKCKYIDHNQYSRMAAFGHEEEEDLERMTADEGPFLEIPAGGEGALWIKCS